MRTATVVTGSGFPTFREGGSIRVPLPQVPPPEAALDSESDDAIRALLAFAGVAHRDGSPAADWSARLFRLGRAIARDGGVEVASLDWDHTLSNFQIFEDLRGLVATRWRTRTPHRELDQAPMSAVEIARPFMTEFGFGLMTGFALCQGVRTMTHWHAYEPRVVVATHTWPDRLGLMGRHFMPILALGEGLLPGAPDTYERLAGAHARSVIHLHHFVEYALDLIGRRATGGDTALSATQRDELATLVADGRVHHRKPLGAWRARGHASRRLLLLDDAQRVVEDARRQAALEGEPGLRAVHVPHPYTGRSGGSVKEWHKVYVPALWTTRSRAIEGAARLIARREACCSPIPALLRAVDGERSARAFGNSLPAGVVLPVHETSTTLGMFWRSYVEPIHRARAALRRIPVEGVPTGHPERSTLS